MNQLIFQDPAWYRAITLTERVASLRDIQRTMSNVEGNADLAKQWIQRWRSQPPFTTASYFAQRLAMDGIGEEELVHLFVEPIEAVHKRYPDSPAWLAELAQAFRRPWSEEPSPTGERTICRSATLLTIPLAGRLQLCECTCEEEMSGDCQTTGEIDPLAPLKLTPLLH